MDFSRREELQRLVAELRSRLRGQREVPPHARPRVVAPAAGPVRDDVPSAGYVGGWGDRAAGGPPQVTEGRGYGHVPTAPRGGVSGGVGMGGGVGAGVPPFASQARVRAPVPNPREYIDDHHAPPAHFYEPQSVGYNTHPHHVGPPAHQPAWPAQRQQRPYHPGPVGGMMTGSAMNMGPRYAPPRGGDGGGGSGFTLPQSPGSLDAIINSIIPDALITAAVQGVVGAAASAASAVPPTTKAVASPPVPEGPSLEEPKSLGVRYDEVIASLYDALPLQCVDSGVRFPRGADRDLADHKDRIFRQREVGILHASSLVTIYNPLQLSLCIGSPQWWLPHSSLIMQRVVCL